MSASGVKLQLLFEFILHYERFPEKKTRSGVDLPSNSEHCMQARERGGLARRVGSIGGSHLSPPFESLTIAFPIISLVSKSVWLFPLLDLQGPFHHYLPTAPNHVKN